MPFTSTVSQCSKIWFIFPLHLSFEKIYSKKFRIKNIIFWSLLHIICIKKQCLFGSPNFPSCHFIHRNRDIFEWQKPVFVHGSYATHRTIINKFNTYINHEPKGIPIRSPQKIFKFHNFDVISLDHVYH